MIFRAVTKSPKLIVFSGFTKWQKGRGRGAITKTLREGEKTV